MLVFLEGILGKFFLRIQSLDLEVIWCLEYIFIKIYKLMGFSICNRVNNYIGEKFFK